MRKPAVSSSPARSPTGRADQRPPGSELSVDRERRDAQLLCAQRVCGCVFTDGLSMLEDTTAVTTRSSSASLLGRMSKKAQGTLVAVPDWHRQDVASVRLPCVSYPESSWPL